MKLLFFQWHSFMNQGIRRSLTELAIPYETFFYQFSDWEQDDVFLERFRDVMVRGAYSVVLSVNFAPLISQICEELGVRYVSWVYDCPLHIRDLTTLTRSCNEIYFFDRRQAEMCRSLGADAYHLPLAVDTELCGRAVASGAEKPYRTDISMVGKLYKTAYAAVVGPQDAYRRGYLEGIIRAQRQIYGGYFIPELITEELLAEMNACYSKKACNDFRIGRRELEFLLACEVTGRERYLALAMLSKHYEVDLYSDERDDRLTGTRYRGYADYETVMPRVFAASRINLNISLRAIQTGIPLRVLDVMGCRGFLLTNYQEELTEYFADGRDCAIYENLEDMYAKASYYLMHDGERQKLACAGYERVKREFTFSDRLGKMHLDRA